MTANRQQTPTKGPRRDVHAGEFLKHLRETRGLSPEEMPRVMIRETGLHKRWIPSARSIRRFEDEGVIPHIRHRFSLAQFFDVHQDEIWRPA